MLFGVLCLIIGGALLLEGFAWAVGASAMRRMYDQIMSQMSDAQIGQAGLVFLGLGAILCLIGVRIVMG